MGQREKGCGVVVGGVDRGRYSGNYSNKTIQIFTELCHCSWEFLSLCIHG